jgi:hypothetical protein
MNYPTLEQVEAADQYTICRWYRFLKSPGADAINKPNFREIMEHEAIINNRICTRLKELGGFTPEISKAIGWGN